MKEKQGFTLIELIVSVTIIAVLTVVGIVSFSGSNQKARDSKRMADMENIRMALELYRQSTGSTYPSTNDYENGILVPDYIAQIPTDPKGVSYTYTPAANGYTYILEIDLEGTGVGYSVTNP